MEFGALGALHEVVVAILRTTCFGWCASRRFHNSAERCRFCGADAGHRQERYLSCDAIRDWAEHKLRMGMEASDGEFHANAVRRIAEGGEGALRMATVINATLYAFDAARLGSGAIARSLCDARIRDLHKRHVSIRDLGMSAYGGLRG